MKATRIEDVSEPEVGRFYDVPAIRSVPSATFGGSFWRGSMVPIIGTLHEDAEHINFPEEHWHVDWRFVGGYSWHIIQKDVERHIAYYHHIGAGDDAILKRPIVKCSTVGEIERVRMKCRRDTPKWSNELPWTRALEDAYAGSSARCGVCPHRGMPLAGAPIENGARVCPGHGLAFDVTTGELRRRAKKPVDAAQPHDVE